MSRFSQLKMIKLVLLSSFLLAFLEQCTAQYKNSHISEGRTGIVHLFEWTFNDIADECKFLGEIGYGGVQISPVQEPKVDDTYSWLLRYQPVSYKIASRSGNLEEFADMVKKCSEQEIRIYVDVVLNQMAMASDDEDEIMGFAKSVANPQKLEYPAVPYQADEFNEFCFVKNNTDPFEVRNCRLIGLPDLNQAKESVRDKIAAFLNELIDLGVAGFRVDAVSGLVFVSW